jgi:hypothetical protein
MASRTVLAVGVAALVLGWSGGARAQETPISKATEAWELGHLAQAGKLYEEALAGGGLTPSDTLAAFVRVGAWRATQGKTDLALSALRNAAIIDPDFECPALGGPRAKPLCERARKEAAGQEKLALSIEAPEGVKHGVDVPIAATLPETLAPLFDSVALAVEDKPGNVVHAEEKPLGEAGTPTKAASARVEFKVPAAEVPAGATLRVRVSVLDAQKNEWARANTTIRVAAKALPPAPPIEPAAPPPPPPPKSSAFWHGSWPYVIGGAILASAAVTIAVAASSGGGDTVTLHAPTWQPTHFSR